MNSEFFCPIRGCPHSTDGDKAPFLTRTTLIRHLHTPIHSSTHHLVNHTRCANAGIYTCCTSSCPSSPKIFFSSLRALHDHCVTIRGPGPGAGRRGARRGGAQMSEMHSNFLINAGGATAADLEGLGEDVRKRVFQHSGITLEWEIMRVGEPAAK